MVHDPREEEEDGWMNGWMDGGGGGGGGGPIKRWEQQLQETCVDVGIDYQGQSLMLTVMIACRGHLELNDMRIC
jgi:hypothetical protein